MPVSYQAFTSKRSSWAEHIDRDDDVGYALSSIFDTSENVTLSRSDLRCLAKDPDLTKFIMSTIIWGYPRGMRGNHFSNLIDHFGALKQLLSTARAQPLADWANHYENVKPITGIGPSTYTKFLSFLSADIQGHTALILDDRIIRIAKQGVFEELAPLLKLRNHNAIRMYPQYLENLHILAGKYEVAAEKIEFFLFEFGLNLKQSLRGVKVRYEEPFEPVAINDWEVLK